MRIVRVHAREVFDSRGKPTVEVEVTCADGCTGRAIVPSGASTGQFEACELRDGGSRLGGTGVRCAVENVIRELGPAIQGMDVAEQSDIDRKLCELDGTANKSHLGANAVLGVSLACAHAAAASAGVPLVTRLGQLWRQTQSVPDTPSVRDTSATTMLGTSPMMPLPMVNMISGGLHAGRNLDFQDFLILPVGATTYREALDWIVTVYHQLGKTLTARGYEGVLVGDEGGYGPKLAGNEQAVELIVAAIEAAGYVPGRDIAIGLDVAATHFFDGTHYRLSATGDKRLAAGEIIDLLEGWVNRYPIISIEDALADDDWDGWKQLTARLGARVQLIGDDLFVTNAVRLRRGIDAGVANSVLVKVNQIGTLTETFATLRLALDHGYTPVVSARSGETEDATIADLAVATGAGQIKIGSVARSERLAKYNQLLRLEEGLGPQASWLGGKIFRKETGVRIQESGD